MPHLSASCRRTSARTKFSVISVEVTEVTSLGKEPRPKDPLKTHKNTMRSLEIIGDHMRSCEIMWDHLTSTLRSSDSKLDDRMRGLHCAKHGGQATPVIPALRTSSISLDKRCTYPWNSYDCQYGSHNDNINNWANMSQHEPTSADFSQKPWFLSSVLLK